MSPPTHGDDNNFFAEGPKGGPPTPHHEGPRTVVTTLPTKARAALGVAGFVVVGLVIALFMARSSGPKGAPNVRELTEAQERVAKLEAEVRDLNAAIGAAQQHARGGEESPRAGAAASAAVSPEQSRLVQELADELGQKLNKELGKGDAAVTRDANGLTLVLSDKLVFEPDVDDISDTGEAVLRHVGTVISRVRGRDIEIRSFTDTKPIPSENEERYSSNWELSALRATQVVRFFQDESNIDPNHLVAMSFGQYHPLPEGTSDRKKRSRRIEVIIPASLTASGTKHNLE